MLNIVTDATFKDVVLDDQGLVMVVCYRSPISSFSEVASQYTNQFKYETLIVMANPKTVAAYNITSFPTVLFFKNGEVVKTIVGYVENDILRQNIDSLLV